MPSPYQALAHPSELTHAILCVALCGPLVLMFAFVPAKLHSLAMVRRSMPLVMTMVLLFAAMVAGCKTGTASGAPHSSDGGDATTGRLHPYQANILEEANKNEAYRRVLFTGARSQLALMMIPAGGDIGLEWHAHVEQLIFIASGQARVVLDGVERPLTAGDVVVVPPNVHHNVINTGTEPLRIYTVYAPPNHIDGRVQKTKAEAEADQADHAFGDAVR